MAKLLSLIIAAFFVYYGEKATACEILVNASVQQNILPEQAEFAKKDIAEATNYYQGGQAAEVINTSLRQGRFVAPPWLAGLPGAPGSIKFSPDILREQIKVIDTAFERANEYQWNPAAHEDLLLFRGRRSKRSSEGRQDSYLSTSFERKVADINGNAFAIFVEKGTPAVEFVRINPDNSGFGQAEVLLPRGGSLQRMTKESIPAKIRATLPEGMDLYRFVAAEPSRLSIVEPGALKAFASIKPAKAKFAKVYAALAKDSFIAAMLARDSGVWEEITLAQHTKTVGKYLTKIVASHQGKISPEQNLLLTTVAVLHDIGKPLAIARGNKNNQHQYTAPIIEQALKGLGFSAREQALGAALIDNGYFRKLISGKLSVVEVKALIEQQAAKVGVDAKEFYLLSKILYSADVASYDLLRIQLMDAKSLQFNSPNMSNLDLEFN